MQQFGMLEVEQTVENGWDESTSQTFGRNILTLPLASSATATQKTQGLSLL
jgi:hypothetical protein